MSQEFKLKIGDGYVGIRQKDDYFEPKNKAAFIVGSLGALKEEWTRTIEHMMNNPTLIFENNLLTLNEVEKNLFEAKDVDALLTSVYKSKKSFYKDFMKSEVSTHVKKQREPNNGRLAVIVPFFHAYSGIEVMRENYRAFMDSIPIDKKDIFTIELSLRGSPFLIKESNDFIRIRGGENSLMWQKERLLNIALKSLPKDYSNVAWIDADIIFENKNISKDIRSSLDEYCFTQLFDTAEWLSHRGEPKETFQSIALRGGAKIQEKDIGPYGFHPGFAWAGRREVLEKTGFFDSHITGNGDSFIFYSIVGNLNSWNYQMIAKLIGFNYKFLKYRDRMKNLADGSVSNISGKISHLFHGEFKNRGYATRQDILIENNFDPQEHLVINGDGIFEWNLDFPEAVTIKENLAKYFRER